MPQVHRLMAAHIVLTGGACCLYLAWPGLRGPLWAVVVLAGAAAVVLGVRTHRPGHRWPWLMLAAGLTVVAVGGTRAHAQGAYVQASGPAPSPADTLGLVAYPLLALGAFGLLRYRRLGRALPGLLDALTVTTGLALVAWIHLVEPLTTREGLTWQQRALALAYPLGDMMLLAMLARLLPPRPLTGRDRAAGLLVLGTVALLLFDLAAGLLLLGGGLPSDALPGFGWIVLCTAWGAAALDPSMAGPATPRPPPRPLPRPRLRLVLLATATLIPPVFLLVERQADRIRGAAVPAALACVLFLLVVWRLAGVAAAHHRGSARERVLRTALAALAAADTPAQVSRCCESAVAALLGPHGPHGSLLLPAGQAPWPQPHAPSALPPGASHDGAPSAGPASGTGPTSEAGTPPDAGRTSLLLPVDRLPPGMAVRLAGARTALVCSTKAPGRASGRAGALLVAGPERRLIEARTSLELLAAHAGAAAERAAARAQDPHATGEAYFRTLLNSTSDVVLVVADDSTVRYASPSARALFGRPDVAGNALRDLIDPQDRQRVDRTLAALDGGPGRDVRDHWRVAGRGGLVEAEAHCRDLRTDETVGGLVVTLRDVTEQRTLRHELSHRAFHDPVTGLPNRTLLLERIGRALLRDHRESSLACVLCIDLDDFRSVNETLGHAAGDRILKAVGERLSETLRRTDTVARLGGDEFAVLMEEARQPLDAELLAEQVIQVLDRPFELPEGTVRVSAGVGVATALDSADAEELLTYAGLAVYAAKSAGNRQWRRFVPRLRVRGTERHDLHARLDRAIAREEFALRYQPVVDIAGGQVTGFEALVRWPQARCGLVSPVRFIPLAEETGHITPLGAWVLRKAAADMARLQQTADSGVAPYVSVNVSGRQWQDTGFLDEVRRAVATPGLAPGSLQLELTESVLVRRDDRLDRVIRSLKELGVRIAVDDFGTGFSSLRYLRDFPVDILKIDKTYIDDIPRDPRQAALVRGIVSLARTLGLQIIAEGIEQRRQRDLLTAMGCRFGQGYLFARPMTVEQSALALRRHYGDAFRPDVPDVR
ncbi:putative bifunctional diguanylate cyclase/phosphodiesterase [Streptomyces sp. NPDC101116]|uniref:putative bifunctional diguanylate cyclase/phosphodiesterase n=1 Tax=Streptomyces sp. NPDC101116 TaxID=3366107 RepID=UPI003806FF80